MSVKSNREFLLSRNLRLFRPFEGIEIKTLARWYLSCPDAREMILDEVILRLEDSSNPLANIDKWWDTVHLMGPQGED